MPQVYNYVIFRNKIGVPMIWVMEPRHPDNILAESATSIVERVLDESGLWPGMLRPGGGDQ